MMITSSEAGRLLGGLSSETLRDYAEKKLIEHERIGVRGRYRFSFDSLRQYAKENQRFFDEAFATELIAKYRTA